MTQQQQDTARTMDAAAVKQRIYGRHPATQRMGSRTVPGQWTLIEEYRGIDVLAVSAHASPKPSIGVRYPRVGYEVKVSRGDLRGELLNPGKRARAVEWCHAFYLAVPAGLLKPEELEWQEPDWFDEPGAWSRERCPGITSEQATDMGLDSWRSRRFDEDRAEPCYRDRTERANGYYRRIETSEDGSRSSRREFVVCPVCEGRGHLAMSRVEREAPTLWVPRDLGLVVCDGRGTKLVKRAPVRHEVAAMESDELAVFTRWVSARPDPRHHGVIERAREVWRGAA